jgi:uncharacterized protein (DUF111 family)
MPPMRVQRIGYGAGGHDFPDRPNVMRLLVGEAHDEAASARAGVDRVTLLTFEIDDMNPQLYGVVMDGLLAAGALDVYYTAVQMKKNRPGTLVTVVAPPERRAALSAIVFRETTTLGVRYHDVDREVLARETVAVETPWGAVPVKVARLPGHGAEPGQGVGAGAVSNAAPEFDACVAIARAHGVAVKDVQAAAVKAWLELAEHLGRA